MGHKYDFRAFAESATSGLSYRRRPPALMSHISRVPSHSLLSPRIHHAFCRDRSRSPSHLRSRRRLRERGSEPARVTAADHRPARARRHAQALPRDSEVCGSRCADARSRDRLHRERRACRVDRAGIAIEAMRSGKDVLVDKPGVITRDALDQVRRRSTRPAASSRSVFRTVDHASSEVAAKLVADGAIGRVIQTVGLGPHRFNRAIRPAWFFDREAAAASSPTSPRNRSSTSCSYTGSTTAEIVHSADRQIRHEDFPDFEDFGEVVLRSDRACGYMRRRLVHAGWLADLGRRALHDSRHRRIHRAAQEHRHRGPARHRPPVHGDDVVDDITEQDDQAGTGSAFIARPDLGPV